MMDKETQEIVKTAAKRNTAIPEYIKEGLFTPRNPGKAEGLDKTCNFFITELGLVNPRNLERGMKIAEDEELEINATHRSNGDTGGLLNIGSRHGLNAFTDRIMMVMGVRMREDPFTSPLCDAMNTVLTMSPIDREAVNERLKNPGKFGLEGNEEALSILKENRKVSTELTGEASRAIQEKKKEGFIPGVYPEATRTRDGYLQRAPRTMSLYYMNPTWVLPIWIEGTDVIFPVNSPAPLPWKRGPVTLIFGEPYNTDEIVAQWKRADRKDANLVDFAMARIAELNPRFVRPKDRSWYQALRVA